MSKLKKFIVISQSTTEKVVLNTYNCKDSLAAYHKDELKNPLGGRVVLSIKMCKRILKKMLNLFS